MKLAVLALGSAVAGACAPQTPLPQTTGAPRLCFQAGNVDSFVAVDDDTVDLAVGPGQVYRVELLGHCDVEWSTAVSVQPRDPTSLVCSGRDFDIVARAPGTGVQRCLARSFRRLTPGEVRAR